ncbi:N-acetylglucosamine-6-phosphate deacetylase [hydrothermal vent metagenome]|uniref:N-acetylglucosamine-6-phosphate deacetylase n=1 Tax=hydrothermal vent metagenome TaxID=652676 RepID=A0A1W1CSS3_9ZZZZ
MRKTAIVNAKLVIDDEILEDKILLYDDKILGILDDIIMSDSDDIDIIDAKGHYVSAGFIDLHIHGSAGVDVMDATPEALEILSKALLKTGTTAFLATTMTMSEEHIKNALANIKNHASSVSGAKILGIHLEGPFINAEKHGAQDKNYVQKANFDLIAEYMDEIKMITLAPEVLQNKAFIEKLAREYKNIILSIGHSSASYDEAKESFTWGISHATHLFNAMNTYHHREPSLIGAVFDSDVTCDIIADLVHTHASTLDLVYRLKKDKLILITDAMRAGCMKCGTYDLGGREVSVNEGKATLEDGTLAGSVLTMNQAMLNMQKHTSMTLVEIVSSVSKIPAQKLGILKGELKEGYDADIVIFDEDFRLISTIVGGLVLHHPNF